MGGSHGVFERLLRVLPWAALRRLRQRLRLVVGATVVAGCLCAGVSAAATAPEYRVKAVFLFQFAQFVEWRGVATDATPFAICILGEDPFHQYLDETVQGEAVKGRQLTVRRYSRVEELENCSILFIAQSEFDQLDSILGALRGEPVLTVSDSTRFAERGGAIQFVTVNNKIKLRINADAAKAAELTISSKLLGLADIVKPGQG